MLKLLSTIFFHLKRDAEFLILSSEVYVSFARSQIIIFESLPTDV